MAVFFQFAPNRTCRIQLTGAVSLLELTAVVDVLRHEQPDLSCVLCDAARATSVGSTVPDVAKAWLASAGNWFQPGMRIAVVVTPAAEAAATERLESYGAFIPATVRVFQSMLDAEVWLFETLLLEQQGGSPSS